VTTLDDLLGYEDEEPEPERTGGGFDSAWWWLAKVALVAAFAAFLVWGLLRLGGLSVPYVLIFMVSLVARILLRLLRWIDPRPLPRTLVRPSGELVSEDQANASHSDGLVMATARWDTRLSWVKLQQDKGQFARTVQPKLVEIIDERLRLRHGVIRTADPDRARAALGEPLWDFVTAPVTRNLTPREIAGLIALMEAI